MDDEKMFMLFQKFVDDENLYSDQMLYFIRAEHLNLINLRKEFVKNAKQYIKKERTTAKMIKSMDNVAAIKEETLSESTQKVG